MSDTLARRIVRALGGTMSPSGGNVPGLGHSLQDRSMAIMDHPRNPSDVLVHSHAGDDWRPFKTELRRLGLISGHHALDRRPYRPTSLPSRSLSAEQEERRRLARQIWDDAATFAGLAKIYIEQARGIICAPSPASLKFHPRCPRARGERPLPALVAAVTIPTTGEFRAVHRIYLGSDGLDKAELPRDQQKRSLGSTSGAAVVLGDLAESDGPILEGEGIETVFSACQMTGLAGIATLSAGTLGIPPLPPDRPVTLLVDRGANEAAVRAASLRRCEGRLVRLAFPPEGFKDFNDALRGAR